MAAEACWPEAKAAEADKSEFRCAVAADTIASWACAADCTAADTIAA